jgi:hypothetical protein
MDLKNFVDEKQNFPLLLSTMHDKNKEKKKDTDVLYRSASSKT